MMKLSKIIKVLLEEKERASSIRNGKFLIRFPLLKETLQKLLSKSFFRFVEGVEVIAPSPALFKVVLTNQYYFFLSYLKGSFQAEVAGKRYDLLNTPEVQRAQKAISNLLKLDKLSFQTENEGGFEPGQNKSLSAIKPSSSLSLSPISPGELDGGSDFNPSQQSGSPESGQDMINKLDQVAGELDDDES